VTLYAILALALACIGAGLWLYRRGRMAERLSVTEGAVEAERRRERVDAKVARMDDAERGAELKRWVRDGID